MSNKHQGYLTQEPIADEQCIVLTNAQVSRIVAFGIIGMLFVFIAGYY